MSGFTNTASMQGEYEAAVTPWLHFHCPPVDFELSLCVWKSEGSKILRRVGDHQGSSLRPRAAYGLTEPLALAPGILIP